MGAVSTSWRHGWRCGSDGLNGGGALLAPVKRRNGGQMAEAAGDRTPEGVQGFLIRVRWDAEAVQADLLPLTVPEERRLLWQLGCVAYWRCRPRASRQKS